jgi:hypothetical protein
LYDGDDDFIFLHYSIGLVIGSISPAYHHGYIEGELLYTIGRLIFIVIFVHMRWIWIALERWIWIALDNNKNIPTGSKRAT